MNNNYYREHGCLWIVPPRCASTSIRIAAGLGQWLSYDEAKADNRLYTIAFARHPFDRAVSALYSIFRHLPPTVSTVIENLGNSHLRPQSDAFRGLRIDFLARFDCLDQDWRFLQKRIFLPDLRHLNRGNARPMSWRETLDWRSLDFIYRDDLSICPDW